MDITPKLQRKSSLSLSTRLNKKRHSASPQSLGKTTTTNGVLNGCDIKTTNEVSRSPSMFSLCSDGGIECTPPHKKSAMSVVDDCAGDYSPKVFDNSFSPSCFLSQTMAIDSPEVGWKWKQHATNIMREDTMSARTPDSAYAADSSFTSAGSSSTETMTNAGTRTNTFRKRIAYDARKEQEFRRVEKTRADEKLKQRCAKLQEQLKSAGTQKASLSQCNGSANSEIVPSTSTGPTAADIEMTSQTNTSTTSFRSPVNVKNKEAEAAGTFNDFFNDSDEDCFLLAATQEIESKIDAKLQKAAKSSPLKNVNTTCAKEPIQQSQSHSPSTAKSSSLSSTDTCTPLTKEKRSSFYMKFLEDDCTDDWFISLDDVILQATQSKKPRTSLQRYKSMPTNVKDVKDSEVSVTKSDSMMNESNNTYVTNGAPSPTAHLKIKRHSSSHALSPASSNNRNQHNRFKK